MIKNIKISFRIMNQEIVEVEVEVLKGTKKNKKLHKKTMFKKT